MTPRQLFQIPRGMSPFGWDVTKDGERFLLLLVDVPASGPSTTVIVDWPALLAKR